MNKFCVYIHTRASDGKIFYVGKGAPQRPRSPSGRSEYWHRVVEKHGLAISIVKSGMLEECALSYERALISALGRENLCNHTDGGDGCRNPSEETRQKMSAAKKGKPKSAEAIRKHSEKMRGRKMTAEAVEKLRLRNLGSRHSETAKMKMRRSANLKWNAIFPPRQIICSATGKVFNTYYEAALWLKENGYPKVQVRAIKEAANGKRISAYGRRWRHV